VLNAEEKTASYEQHILKHHVDRSTCNIGLVTSPVACHNITNIVLLILFWQN